MEQINEAYDYINKVFDKHAKEIVLPSPPPVEIEAPVKVTIKRKKATA